jgi:hypothetical protein
MFCKDLPYESALWFMPIILAMGAKGGSFLDPSSISNPSMVVGSFDPSYLGGVGRRIAI